MVAYNNMSMTATSHHPYDLNSLQKPSRTIRKPPTAAASNAQQNPPKVYKVQPIHFRELVQKLTGAHTQSTGSAEPTTARRSNALYRVAPPAPLPITISPYHLQTQTNLVAEKQVSSSSSCKATDQKAVNGGWEGMTTELTLSPNFQSWFNFAMLSPGPAPVSH